MSEAEKKLAAIIAVGLRVLSHQSLAGEGARGQPPSHAPMAICDGAEALVTEMKKRGWLEGLDL